ncbi:hypothetical protein [Actinoplanes sp. M2I2]|uniref:hypothetical protein n=1 Tax=Actinoplanes sp. M2I2 TaxID=1734444 RepID=UPI0020223420|nr:hypothetical protein [Actinoplanes sp. M2I2]
MVIADETMPADMPVDMMPADVVDRLLWQDAQQMLGRHAEPADDGNCVWCGWRWPCAPRRLAERADIASRRPWREAWTVRHDLNSIRAMRGPDDRRHPTPNRGYFD